MLLFDFFTPSSRAKILRKVAASLLLQLVRSIHHTHIPVYSLTKKNDPPRRFVRTHLPAKNEKKWYEEAFEEVKTVSNIDDLDRLVAVFMKQEDEHFSLFNYIQTVNQETDQHLEKTEELEVTTGTVPKHCQIHTGTVNRDTLLSAIWNTAMRRKVGQYSSAVNRGFAANTIG